MAGQECGFCGCKRGARGQAYLADVSLGGGGNDVGLVHPSEGHAIDGEGAGDQKEAGGELAQEDNALALEAACQDDEDGAGRDAGPQLGGGHHLSAGLGVGGVISWVELEWLQHIDAISESNSHHPCGHEVNQE